MLSRNVIAVINAIQQQASSSISATDKNAAIGEAKFIRAVAYYHLAVYWGAVPIIEDNSKLIKNPLLNRNIVSDVYKFVAKDLTYAAQNLPAKDVEGRVTTWSAQGMLGKVYLTMAGLGQSGGTRSQPLLDSAKKYAGNVCKNSGLVFASQAIMIFSGCKTTITLNHYFPFNGQQAWVMEMATPGLDFFAKHQY